MTQIKLKGLDARFARVAREVGNIEALIRATNPSHPALAHTGKVALAVMEAAADCKSILTQALATDRRAAATLSGEIGGLILRHYLTGNDLLAMSARYIPSDAENGLNHRVDTFLWLCDSAKEETSIDNLALIDAATERRRQYEKWGYQHNLTREQHASILMEEVGEVFKAINEGNPDEMRQELIEVAACALKWVAEIEYKRRREEEESTNGYKMVEHRPSPGIRNPYNPAVELGDMA